MSVIHQIYCTHCTHGSSALERREGDLAERTLGYSARAGSLETAALRRHYRQIERYTYYYLPRDTPANEKLRLTADTAPQRLIYLPAKSGLQMLGHVCYRPTDTQGRPGSYFAHVLFSEEGEREVGWSGPEGLRLWAAAGWVREDARHIPFLLRPFDSVGEMLGEMLRGRPPAVDDDVLSSFLSSPAGGPFHDPGGVIPQRWRGRPPGQRRAALLRTLGALLEVDVERRGSVLLVIEPSLAALLFYGILRLLPDGPLRRQISYCTFEPNADRLCTTLAATWFYDPQRAGVTPEGGRTRGPTIDTLRDEGRATPQRDSAYARHVVDTLLCHGWRSVDRMLENIRAAGAESAEDLERLAAAERVAAALLRGHTPPSQDPPKSPQAVDDLRRALAQELSTVGEPSEALRPLVGRPAQWWILELLADGNESSSTRAAVEYLLANVPDAQIPRLINLEQVSRGHKAALLGRYVTAHGDLPPGCEGLWEEAAQAGTRRPAPLLPEFLGRLDAAPLEAFYRKVRGRRAAALIHALAESCRRPGATRDRLTQIVTATDQSTVLSLFDEHGSEFFRQYPRDEPALGVQLHEILHSLPEHPEAFSRRLDLLLAGGDLLPTDLDQAMLAGWQKCRRAILDIGRLQGRRSRLFRARQLVELDDAARRMTESIAQAMPSELYDDDPRGTARRRRLLRIGRGLLGGRALLPPGAWQSRAVWQKYTWYFDARRWPATRLAQLRPKPRSRRTLWIALGSLAATVVLCVGLAAWMIPKDARQEGRPQENRPSQQHGAAAANPAASGDAVAWNPAGRPARHQPAAGDPVAEEPDEARAEPGAERPAGPRAPAPEETESPQVPSGPEEAPQEAPEEEQGPQEVGLQATEDREAAKRAEARARQRLLRERAWRAAAERFARTHRGTLLENQPLEGGAAVIPAEAVTIRYRSARLYLGPGRLQLDTGTYEFGKGSETSVPARRQAIPELATELGFESVWVEIDEGAGGLSLCVDGDPPAVSGGGASAGLQRQIESRTSLRQKLSYQLRQWNRRESTRTPEAADKRDEILRTVIRLARIKIPTIPPRPNPAAPQYEHDPQALQDAERRYRAATEAQKRTLESAVPQAQKVLAALNREIAALEADWKKRRNRGRRDRERLREELKRRCRQITAVVYEAAEAEAAGADGRRNPPGEKRRP